VNQPGSLPVSGRMALEIHLLVRRGSFVQQHGGGECRGRGSREPAVRRREFHRTRRSHHRYGSDAHRLPGFGLGGVVSTYALAALPDGAVIIGGRYTPPLDSNSKGIIRLAADASWMFLRIGRVPYVYALAPLSDGGMLVAGSMDSPEADRVARLRPDGSVDMTFAPILEPRFIRGRSHSTRWPVVVAGVQMDWSAVGAAAGGWGNRPRIRGDRALIERNQRCSLCISFTSSGALLVAGDWSSSVC